LPALERPFSHFSQSIWVPKQANQFFAQIRGVIRMNQ